MALAATSLDLDDCDVEETDHYLGLSDRKLTFEASSKSKLTNVFYDESNSQVFSIHSGDVTDVTAKCPDPESHINFKMDERGHVTSIRFSQDLKILAVQRVGTAIDFVTFVKNEGTVNICETFTYTLKGPSAVIHGYHWTSQTNIVLLTDEGIKLCKVDEPSKNVSLIKSLNISIKWFMFYPPSRMILINNGAGRPVFNLFQITDKGIAKVAKQEMDLEDGRPELVERDVVLAEVYSQLRVLIMDCHGEPEIIVYTVVKGGSLKKSHVLRLGNQGKRFAVNIVDNLVMVHNQVSRTTSLFDLGDEEWSGSVKYLEPVTRPAAIRAPPSCQLYSPNWIVFQPDVVMDAKLGFLWKVELLLGGFLKSMSDYSQLISFLLLRTNSKFVIAGALLKMLDGPDKKLEQLGDVLDQINRIYRSQLDANMQAQLSLGPGGKGEYPEVDPVVFKWRTVLDQLFMYSYVFSKLADRASSRAHHRSFSWCLLEYIRSLVDYQIPVAHYIYELLINSLVICQDFYQLHQLLQYHAISDSKPLACLLLSLENLYPAASQLAIDMLERLGTAKDEIIDILLSKKQIMTAVRYAKDHIPPNERLSGVKFLDAACRHGDEKLLHSICHHFKLPCDVSRDSLAGLASPTSGS